jgi:hypothetical protein
MSILLHRSGVYVKLSINRSRKLERSIPVNDAIILAIWQRGKNGIKGKDLENSSGVSRQTINHERQNLKEAGLIDYTHTGKRTTYYPGKLVMDDQYLRSIIYGMKLLDRFTNPPLKIDSPYCRCELRYEEKTERTIIEFALRMGIILTYFFIEIMDPNSKSLILTDKMNSDIISSKEIKEHLINKWLKNSIDLHKILIKLRQSFYHLGYKFKIDVHQKNSVNHSFFELENKSYTQIKQAFTRVFPTASEQLEKVGSDLSKDIDYWRMRRKLHECRHDYQMSIEKNTKVFVCARCDNRIAIAIDEPSNTQKEEERISTETLNALKPPVDNNCIKFGHQWDDRTGYQVNKIWYACLLCRATIQLDFESDEEMQLIEEEVSINIVYSM